MVDQMGDFIPVLYLLGAAYVTLAVIGVLSRRRVLVRVRVRRNREKA